MFVVAKCFYWLCWSVGNHSRNLAKTCCLVKSSLRIHWHVPYKRPILLLIFRMVLHWLSLTVLWTFSYFSFCVTLQGADLNTCIFQPKFPHWFGKTPFKSLCSSHDVITKSCLNCLMHSQCSFPSLKHNLMQMHCPFISKYRLHLTCMTINTQFRSSTDNDAYKTN